jgi:hypothetical protein
MNTGKTIITNHICKPGLLCGSAALYPPGKEPYKKKSNSESRTMVAWAGLGIPKELTKEEWSSITASFQLPPSRNEGLHTWFHDNLFASAAKYGYDPAKHCRSFISHMTQGLR